MTLSHALSNAYSGLVASARKADVVANNIANVNTEGYARRSVNLSAQVIDGRGAGVQVVEVEVATAGQMTDNRRLADADQSYQEVISSTNAELARLIGDTDDPGALFERYAALEESLRSLADDPEAVHLMTDVERKAQDVASGFREIDTALSRHRNDLDAQISHQVDTLNATLTQIEELNADIVRGAALNRGTAEVVAERDRLLDNLSGIVAIETFERGDGGVDVYTSSGYALIAPKAATIEFTEAGVVSSDMDLRGGAPGALSGLTSNGVDVTPETGTITAFESGSLAALFEARDGSTVTFQKRVDSLAQDLIERFSDATVEPDLTVGDPGLFTDAQTAPTGVMGLAGRIEVNALVDPDAGGNLTILRDGIGGAASEAGDNSHIQELLSAMTMTKAAPADSGVSGARSASDLMARFGSLIATDSAAADATLALRAARRDSLFASETTAIGVDLDQELQSLTLVETAYAANARVMEVIDGLFKRLMEI